MHKFLIKKPKSKFQLFMETKKPDNTNLKRFIFCFILIIALGFTMNFWLTNKINTIYAQETKNIDDAMGSVKGAYTLMLENSQKPADTLLFEGMNLVKKNKIDIALMTLEKAVQKDANYRDGALYTGYVFLENGQYEKAKVYLEKARDLDPLYAKTYELLGFTYTQLGDALNAELCYNKAKEFNTEELKN